MTLLGLLQAGGSFLQGAFGAAGAQQETRANNAMLRRRALRLGDVASMLEGVDSMARLPQAYSRVLAGSTEASRASAAMRGMGGSGMQGEMEARMQGQAVAELANAVNQAEMQRLNQLAAIYSDPAFGALEDDELPDASALIALQGLLGAGMSLAPLFGGMGGGAAAGTAQVDRRALPPAGAPATGAQHQRGLIPTGGMNPMAGRLAAQQGSWTSPPNMPGPLVPQYGPTRQGYTWGDW
jgi:hypothetical protein